MQTQEVQFHIDTYGSCRHSEVVVIHPKRIDLRVYTNRRGVNVTDLGIIKIKYDNHDSSKNLHRDIEIVEVREPIVVRFFGARSCSKRFDEVYIITPPNNIRKLAPEEVKEELVEEENGKYRHRVLVRYIEVNGTRVIVEKTVMEKEPILQKLEIKVKVSENTIEVYGDTFHIKEILKELKFKWDYTRKVWYMKCPSEDDANYVLFELEAKLKERGVSLVVEGVENE
jgi:hypothetical protein